MTDRVRWVLRLLSLLVVISLVAVSCGSGDDSDTSAEESVEDTADASDDDAAADLGETDTEALEILDAPDLTEIVSEVAIGVGDLSTAQERSIQGLADGVATCTNVADERARPAASQVEVEIITVVEGCLNFSYDVANFRSLIEDLDRLRNGPDVLAASPLLLEYRLNQFETPWPLEAIEGSSLLTRADAPAGQGVVIAVIDSGIDVEHPALENANVQRVPDSGTGDYTITGHGTVAATIIVAPVSGAARGIAPEATLLDVPADLCDRASCGCDPCAEMTAAEAIRWSVDNGADIVSMSFGYRPAAKPAWWQILLDAGEVSSATETIDVALAYAAAQNVAMTAAAGNCAGGEGTRCENEDQFEIPAGHESVIGVGALAQDDEGAITRAWYSTRQPYVELAAPGSVIILDEDGSPVDKVGTSFATPFVSASLAVLLSSDGPLQAHPDAADIARQMLIDTAVDLAPDGRDSDSGHGQLQLEAALEAAEEFARTNPPELISEDE